MRNEFTAIIEQDEGWYIAYSPEVPGANGQGRSKDEALQSLRQAIALILQERREDGLRGVPPAAIRETVTVGMKTVALLRHLRQYGCVLKREGAEHSLWTNPRTGHAEAVPPHKKSRTCSLAASAGASASPTPAAESRTGAPP